MTSLAGLVKPHEFRVPHESFPREETPTMADACVAEFQRKLVALDEPGHDVAQFAPNVPWDKADPALKQGETYHQCIMEAVPQTYDEQRVLKVWADANMHMLPDAVSAGMYSLSHTLPDLYNGWAAYDATGAPRLHPDASRRKVASFSARVVEERTIMSFDTAAQVKIPSSFVRRSAT